MGTWGTGIFEDDTALDIKGTFEDSLADGLSVDAATQRVLVEYSEAFEDYDEASVSWLALASTQLEHEVLQPEIRDKALAVIEDNSDLRRWEESASAEDLGQRGQVLEDLKARLLAV